MNCVRQGADFFASRTMREAWRPEACLDGTRIYILTTPLGRRHTPPPRPGRAVACCVQTCRSRRTNSEHARSRAHRHALVVASVVRTLSCCIYRTEHCEEAVQIAQEGRSQAPRWSSTACAERRTKKPEAQAPISHVADASLTHARRPFLFILYYLFIL